MDNLNYLTKYEKARIIGTRALQLDKGAVPMVPIDGLTSAMEIAKKEYYTGNIPIIVRRKYPDNSFKDIKASEAVCKD